MPVGRPAKLGRNSQYPLWPGAIPRLTLPSGQRGVGSTGRRGAFGAPLSPFAAAGGGGATLSWAKKGTASENNSVAATAAPVATRRRVELPSVNGRTTRTSLKSYVNF